MIELEANRDRVAVIMLKPVTTDKYMEMRSTIAIYSFIDHDTITNSLQRHEPASVMPIPIPSQHQNCSSGIVGLHFCTLHFWGAKEGYLLVNKKRLQIQGEFTPFILINK